MFNYSIIIKLPHSDEVSIRRTTQLEEALGYARDAVEEAGPVAESITVSWYRDSDGSVGYLNPDGSHEAYPESWLPERMTEKLHLRLTIGEKAKLTQAARSRGVSASSLIRQMIREIQA